MIRFTNGDIFNSSAHCLVNTVNCEGFMGKGIAYQFKEKFPKNNKEYVRLCKVKKFSIGDILFFEEGGKIIANFPTKDHWRDKSEYSYIDLGLIALKNGVIEKEISSIAIPPLGCGNGGLSWDIVKQKIIQTFDNSNIDVTVYEPPIKVMSRKNCMKRLSASHLILMKLKGNIPKKKFCKLRLQKAAFFLNVFSGEDYFNFEEYKFGPYAHSIEVLSNQIKAFQESYNITTVEAEEILYKNIISDSVKANVEKFKNPILQATSFINSIESNHELEVVATVVAIVKLFPHFNEKEIVSYFLNTWPKYDKTRFDENEIKVSLHRLIKSDILIPELIGFSISDKTQQDSSLMPQYQMN